MWSDVLNQLAARSWQHAPVRVPVTWLAADLSAWPTTTPTERIMWSVQSVMRWIGRMTSFDLDMVEHLTAIATMYAHLLRDVEQPDGDEAC